MKVFNWVHRKFVHVHVQSNSNFIEEDEKRSSSFEKRALLDDQHADEKRSSSFEKRSLLDDQHNTWGKDGILAIGTLGIGPFDANNDSNQVNSSVDQIFQEDILFPHNQDHNHHDHGDNNDHDDHVIVTEKELVKVETCHEIEEVGADDNNSNNNTNINIEIIQMTSGNHESEKNTCRKRVTLADLFSEDSDHHHSHHHDAIHGTKYTLEQVLLKDDDESTHDNGRNNNIGTQNPNESVKKKKPNPSRAKIGFKKAKKILKDDFRPIDMFNQLMTRMIKKKIHPDVQEKMQKDTQMQPMRNEDGPHEASSLFLVQDVMV